MLLSVGKVVETAKSSPPVEANCVSIFVEFVVRKGLLVNCMCRNLVAGLLKIFALHCAGNSRA